MKFVIEHLSKSFEKKEVLRDIDFTFDEGKIYGLLGRNGAGKTTLFNCLNRDLKADSGNFYIEDENGQHISILILFFMINRSLSRIINIITYFFFDSFIKLKPDKIPLSSANGKRKK